MGQGISEILTFAVGVAISPVPIIAVTLMLFSQRARVNGPVFLLGWVVALAIVSGVVYALADQGDAATDSTTSVAIAWGKIVFGVLFLGLLLAGVNPKNLMLAAAAGAGLAQLGLSTGDAVGSLIVFVAIGSLTIAGPVVYYLVGGEQAKARLDEMKDWLAVHNDAVMAVLFLVFGVNLIAKGLPPLT